MNKLPTVSSYGNRGGANYGTNSLHVTIGDLDLFYSYSTIVGFNCHAVNGGRRVVIKNYWGPTTGKHLNEISDKNGRLEAEAFGALLQQALAAHGFEQAAS